MSDSQSIKDFEMDETFDPSIPDASNWTYDDVYNYFVQYFPEEAIVFKEQVSFHSNTCNKNFIFKVLHECNVGCINHPFFTFSISMIFSHLF